MLAVTPGEPAGVGPDLIIALAQAERSADWAVLADPDLLLARARLLELPLKLSAAPSRRPGSLHVEPVPLAAPATPGEPSAANAGAVIAALEQAVDGCLEGRFQALVTGPVQKSVINEAGISFSGHTEFMGQRCGTGEVLMMLLCADLRVGLATTHLPLAAVPSAITSALVEAKLSLMLQGLRERFAIDAPQVLVTGLNPHAGESGHLGREELDVIEPVCARFRAAGERVLGPVPADTAFRPQRLAGIDAVLAMYHDQGLPALKAKGFGNAVNLTLGLPFVRTSVDHGTALDLAGRGGADCGSLLAALRLAERLSR